MKANKKLIALVPALCLALLLCACGGEKAPAETPAPTPEVTEAPVAATPAPTPEPTEAPGVGAEPVTGTPEGSLLFDTDGIRVTTAGLGEDDGLAIIWVDVENYGEKDLYLGVTDGAVNGFMTDAYLINFYEDGADYAFDQLVPAGETVRYALGYNGSSASGIDLSTLGELCFCFTLTDDASFWPYLTGAPVTLETGEAVPEVDLTAFGTPVIDNDKLLLVIGAQDYDDFFGPEVEVYFENRTDGYVGLAADSAEADGVYCDYIYGTIFAAPYKRAAGFMCFEGELAELKGFEDLSVTYSLYEAETHDELNMVKGEELAPVTVTYPPQIWGEYENGGYTMSIKPKYNSLVTVELPEGDEAYGGLFDVYETASMEAGDHEGAGWLFSIGKISADRLHEMLCQDMSGEEVFAKDGEGNYFVYYHPTDVRYERATAEEMQRDAQQWSMLCEWADSMQEAFRDANGLDKESNGNSELDMYVARAAWDKSVTAYLATTEFMDVDARRVDGTPWADFVLHGYFWEAEEPEDDMLLSGEHLVLGFLPDEEVLLHFYPVDNYVRVEIGDSSQLYQAAWYDDNISYYEAMLGWYYACAEKAGIKQADTSLDAYLGGWAEEIAGRGTVMIEKSLAPGKLDVSVRWPDSVSVCHYWTLVASAQDDGALFYENGEWEVIEYDEDGNSWTTDNGWDETGRFEIADGKLVWHNDARPETGESVFVRAK